MKTLQNAILVPTAAVQRNGTQAFVYIVSGNTVKLRNIEELTNENQVAAVTGVDPGEVVPITGFDKLQNGARVIVEGFCSQSGTGRKRRGRSVWESAVNPARIFILRPIATILLMAAILIVGLVAYTTLPISALPEADYPTMQVLTFYPGASPQVMSSAVTAPLERQFGQVAGPHSDDLDQFRQQLGHCAAVLARFEHRCG